MKDFRVDNVRNIGIIGHGSTGKTSLAEAILFGCREIDRMGKIEEGTTFFDYDPEEKKRRISLTAAIAPVEWNDYRIYLVDTPGYFDFEGEVIGALRAIDCALINVCGVAGHQVGTEKAWDYAKNYGIPRAFFVNRLDRENAVFDTVYKGLRDKFGLSVVPIYIPVGKEASFKGVVDIIDERTKIYDSKAKKLIEEEVPSELVELLEEYKHLLIEAVAETDEELLEKYLMEGTLTNEEIISGLRRGIASGDISPVFCGSAVNNIGIEAFLDGVARYLPSPSERSQMEGINPRTNEKVVRKPKQDEPFSAFVFKTIADPFVGRLSLFRVMSGELNQDATVYNSTQDKQERISGLYMMKGKNQVPIQKLRTGEIGAVSKLQYTITGDTLCEIAEPIVYEGFKFPEPSISMSVRPKAKGDEDKISTGLARLIEEDPTFKVTRDSENAETIISGLGELHIEVVASKLKGKFGVDVDLDLPKIPYRETIKRKSDVQGKHKKQSGGHGQYGDVKIIFEPQFETTDLVFVDKVVGGAVPRQYIPAVEKGLRDCIKKGVLAGYPVINLKATLYDGTFHPVDSSEMAFKTAASIAYKKGLKEAQPILLEPVMSMQITIPEEYLGDIMGDVNRRRGRVIGMEQAGRLQVVSAEIPLSEVYRYATDLRSMTQARGYFTMKFVRYDEVPANISQKIVENAQNSEDEE